MNSNSEQKVYYAPFFMGQCQVIYNSSLKFSKAIYGLLALIAFLIQSPWLVLAVSVLMALEIFSIKFNLPYHFHTLILRKMLGKKQTPIQKESGELAFVCAIASTPLFISFLLLYFGKAAGFAWGLVLVIALLLLLSGIGFCVASLMYVLFKKISHR